MTFNFAFENCSLLRTHAEFRLPLKVPYLFRQIIASGFIDVTRVVKAGLRKSQPSLLTVALPPIHASTPFSNNPLTHFAVFELSGQLRGFGS